MAMENIDIAKIFKPITDALDSAMNEAARLAIKVEEAKNDVIKKLESEKTLVRHSALWCPVCKSMKKAEEIRKRMQVCKVPDAMRGNGSLFCPRCNRATMDHVKKDDLCWHVYKCSICGYEKTIDYALGGIVPNPNRFQSNNICDYCKNKSIGYCCNCKDFNSFDGKQFFGIESNRICPYCIHDFSSCCIDCIAKINLLERR